MMLLSGQNIQDNVLMHQSGGEEVRIGIAWNRDVILDIFSINGGDIHVMFTPTIQYIKQEFIDYGYDDIASVINKIYAARHINDNVPAISKTLVEEPYHKVVKLNTEHIITISQDSVVIETPNSK